jgi:hypothetical protein
VNRRVLISLLGAYAVGARPQEWGPPLSRSDVILFTPISEGIRRAQICFLYEGLPSPISDADQFNSELITKETLQFRDYPFYKKRLLIRDIDVNTLRKLSASPDTYWGARGPKHCVPFHPDYCLVWIDNNVPYEQLICFGCREMELYGPEQTVSLDIRSDAATQFANTLRNYRGERPRPLHGWNF